MNFTYEEALKEMDFLVEKMQLVLPTESYRIQCAWEAIKSTGGILKMLLTKLGTKGMIWVNVKAMTVDTVTVTLLV